MEVPDPIGMNRYGFLNGLDESKATPLTQKNVMENAFISTFVNSAYVNNIEFVISLFSLLSLDIASFPAQIH